MKRPIGLILLLSLLLSAVFLTACSSEHQQQSTENGAMTEIKDDNGNLTGYERRFYDDNGNVTRLDVFDENQTYLHYDLYEYDESNRLYTETRYSAEGFGEYRYVYTYDDDGNLTEKAYELSNGEAQVFRYDPDGTEKERLYYDFDEHLVKREVFENGKWVAYDADGKIIK